MTAEAREARLGPQSCSAQPLRCSPRAVLYAANVTDAELSVDEGRNQALRFAAISQRGAAEVVPFPPISERVSPTLPPAGVRNAQLASLGLDGRAGGLAQGLIPLLGLQTSSRRVSRLALSWTVIAALTAPPRPCYPHRLRLAVHQAETAVHPIFSNAAGRA